MILIIKDFINSVFFFSYIPYVYVLEFMVKGIVFRTYDIYGFFFSLDGVKL